MSEFPKGCHEKTGGMFYFARMCSKIRLRADGTLPESHWEYLGQGFDGRTCRYLEVSYEAVRERVNRMPRCSNGALRTATG